MVLLNKLINYFKKLFLKNKVTLLDCKFSKLKSSRYYLLEIKLSKINDIELHNQYFKYYNLVNKEHDFYNSERLSNISINNDNKYYTLLILKLECTDLYNMYEKDVYMELPLRKTENGDEIIKINLSRQLEKQEEIINELTLMFKQLANTKK